MENFLLSQKHYLRLCEFKGLEKYSQDLRIFITYLNS